MSGPQRPIALVTAPVRGPGLATLRELADVIEEPWLVADRPLRILNDTQLAARATELGATIIVSEADVCGPAVCELPLVAIGSTRGDPTNVDLVAATARGIPVLRAPGRNADGVAEMTVALLLAVTRGLIPADADVRAGRVFADGLLPYQRYRAWEIAGRTAGLVGLGAVGRATKWRLEGLGMRVLTADPFAADATSDLESLLAVADVVSMHAAVGPDTIGMMGAAQFAAMRPGAVYLNTARAALHDLDALVDALDAGRLAGAGLDHFEGEQLPDGHPLTTMNNVVLTPHIGGATYDTEVHHTMMIADDLAALLQGGRPRYCANPEVLR